MIGIYLQAAPWALPAALLGGLLVAAVAGPLARRTGLSPLVVLGAGLSWVGFLAVTATPSEIPWVRTDLGLGEGGLLSLSPDAISWASLTQVNERSLNVWLAVPLGLFSALLAVRLRTLGPLVAAALAPVAVEGLQALVPQLGRAGFLLADVTLNWTGLALGAAAGLLLALLAAPFAGRSGMPQRVGGPGPHSSASSA